MSDRREDWGEELRELKRVFEYNKHWLVNWPVWSSERKWVSKLIDKGLAKECNGHLKLTPAGILLAESM